MLQQLSTLLPEFHVKGLEHLSYARQAQQADSQLE